MSDGGSHTAVDELTTAVFGQIVATELVGHVRNTVPPGTRYDWPAPVAHLAVYRAVGHAVPVLDGTWLDEDSAAEHLRERHWWPLVAVDHGNATVRRAAARDCPPSTRR